MSNPEVTELRKAEESLLLALKGVRQKIEKLEKEENRISGGEKLSYRRTPTV